MTRYITVTTAKYVLAEMFKTGRSALSIVEEQNLWQIGDTPTPKKVEEPANKERND